MEKFDPTMSLKEDTLNLAESPWVVVRSGNEPIPNVKSQELFDTMAPENFKETDLIQQNDAVNNALKVYGPTISLENRYKLVYGAIDDETKVV